MQNSFFNTFNHYLIYLNNSIFSVYNKVPKSSRKKLYLNITNLNYIMIIIKNVMKYVSYNMITYNTCVILR